MTTFVLDGMIFSLTTPACVENRLRRKTKHNAYQVRQDAEHQHEYEDLPTNDPGVVQRTCVECGHAMNVEVM
jgi:hypothetical protein